MKKTIFILSTVTFFVYVAQCFAQTAGSVALIKYGVVESAQTVKKDQSMREAQRWAGWPH